MKTIDLGLYGLQVICNERGVPTNVTSSLRHYFELGYYPEDEGSGVDTMLESFINSIEAIVLAHAYQGVNVCSTAYVAGIRMWVEMIAEKSFHLDPPPLLQSPPILPDGCK